MFYRPYSARRKTMRLAASTLPGYAGRQHAAKEFISVDGFRKAVAFAVRLMWRLGRG